MDYLIHLQLEFGQLLSENRIFIVLALENFFSQLFLMIDDQREALLCTRVSSQKHSTVIRLVPHRHWFRLFSDEDVYWMQPSVCYV